MNNLQQPYSPIRQSRSRSRSRSGSSTSLPISGPTASGSGTTSPSNGQVKPLPRPPTSKWTMKNLSSWGAEKIEVIELIYRKSARDGALTFADGGDLNGWQVFISQYAGTVASVIYAILLSFVDLDAKRLEPWFELSKPDGATARDSLLLCYPFDFLAFVPFKAAKRGHWSVFYIGTASVLVFWLITPLQSSLIATVQQERTMVVPFQTTQKLQKLSVIGPETPSFVNTAYSIARLNATPPMFATVSEAMLPFEPVSSLAEDLQSEIWVANTTAYYTDLECSEAEREIFQTSLLLPNGKNESRSYFHDKETNCTFEHNGFPTFLLEEQDYLTGVQRPYYGQLIGYHSGPNALYYLNTSTCRLETDPHMFLLIFSYLKSVNDTATVNALYCKQKYLQRPAEVIFDQKTQAVKNVTYFGQPEILNPQSFDATLFETIISGGGISSSNGGPFNSLPEHRAKTQDITSKMINVYWDSESSVLGYLFAIEPNLDRYLDRDMLSSTANKAYKLLFSAYSNTKLFIPEINIAEGKVNFIAEAVVVPEVFARILEGLLLAVLVLLICFSFATSRRQTGLIYDPASLAGTMALVANDRQLLEKFNLLDGTSSINELQHAVTADDLRFKLESKSEHYQLSILTNNSNSLQPTSRDINKFKSEQEKNFELGATAGTIFILVLTGILTFLLYLFFYGRSNNGLPSFGDNIFVFQLLYSYIPTAIGTFLEPFWVLLTRFLCVLQPLETLRRGNAFASNSLALKFESVPPSMTIFSAFKSSHYFLSMLAATALSTNVLAIALGALFDPDIISIPRPVSMDYKYQNTFQNLPLQFATNGIVDETSIPTNYFAVGPEDHFYTLYANFTSGTPLPAWTTPNNFFLPIEVVQDKEANSTDTFNAQTIGLAAELLCETIVGGIPKENELPMENSRSGVRLQTTAFKNSGPQCESESTFFYDELVSQEVPGNRLQGYEGPIATEGYPVLSSISGTIGDNETCNGLIPTIFFRGHALTNRSDFDIANIKRKAVICRPQLSASYFDIVFDSSNRILKADKKAGTDIQTKSFFTSHINEIQLLAAIGNLIRTGVTELGNKALIFSGDSLPRDWINLMIQLESNDTTAFDPNTAIDDIDYEKFERDLSTVYTRVFSVIIGLYYDQIFTRRDEPRRVQGEKIALEKRVEMSIPMFVLAAALLGWYVLLATNFYLFRVSRLFQRLPTSIASEIQLFHSSAALDDVRGTELLTSKQREQHLSNLGRKYGYGRFVGRDGIMRVGIEREPLLDHMLDSEVRNQGLGRIGLRMEKVIKKIRTFNQN